MPLLNEIRVTRCLEWKRAQSFAKKCQRVNKLGPKKLPPINNKSAQWSQTIAQMAWNCPNWLQWMKCIIFPQPEVLLWQGMQIGAKPLAAYLCAFLLLSLGLISGRKLCSWGKRCRRSEWCAALQPWPPPCTRSRWSGRSASEGSPWLDLEPWNDKYTWKALFADKALRKDLLSYLKVTAFL